MQSHRLGGCRLAAGSNGVENRAVVRDREAVGPRRAEVRAPDIEQRDSDRVEQYDVQLVVGRTADGTVEFDIVHRGDPAVGNRGFNAFARALQQLQVVIRPARGGGRCHLHFEAGSNLVHLRVVDRAAVQEERERLRHGCAVDRRDAEAAARSRFDQALRGERLDGLADDGPRDAELLPSLNGEQYTVVGVMAPGAPDRLDTEIVAPLAFKPEQINHDFHFILVMGRLKPGITIAQAQADMNVVADGIAKDFPQSNKGWGISVEPLKNDFFPSEAQKTLWLLLGAVGFVLLIACANVANLLLAKGTTRLKEVAIRTSLGATRWRVFNQFLTESMMLAFLGGIAGIGLSALMLKVLTLVMPPYTLPSEANVTLSVQVLLFTLGCTMIAGILFGCAPAWRASGVSLNETLKEGGRSGSSRSHNRLRQALVISEFGLALTLLAGAGLAIHSFWNLARVDLGISKDHTLTFFLPFQDSRFADSKQIVTFYRQLLEKTQALPGVTHAEVATGTPIQGANFGMPFNVVGTEQKDAGSRPGAAFQMVTPDFFKTFDIQVVKGRSFTEQDVEGSPRVAIVNENFANKYLKGDPLGKRLLIEQLIPGVTKLGPSLEWEVVGVIHNVRSGGPRSDDYAEITVPFYQSAWPNVGMAVRTTSDPAAMTKTIAAVVSSMDPNISMANIKTMDQIVQQSLLGDRFIVLLFATFAGTALLLAAIGIYGVMAFVVAERTREIGLRVALGAGRSQVLQLILKEGVVLALIGLGVGLLGALFIGRAIRSTLYGVGTIDFAAFTAVSLILLASALLACYLPAQRATKVDPMVALRYE